MVRELNDHTEQIVAGQHFAKHIVNRIPPLRLGEQNKGPPPTGLLDLFRPNAVSGNVLDTIGRPDELLNLRSFSLRLG